MRFSVICHWSLFLGLGLSGLACNETKDNTPRSGPVLTATIEQYESYKDYSPVFSGDGTKAVFLSKRVEKTPYAFLYDSGVDVKLSRITEKLGLTSEGAQENLASLNQSGSFVAINRKDTKSVTEQIFIASLADERKASLTQAQGARVSELSFAKGSDEFFAYTVNQASVSTIKVVKLTTNDAEIRFSEVGSFEGESAFRFISLSDGLRLVSFASDSSGAPRPIRIRSFVPSTGEWTLQASDIKLSTSEIDRGYSLSAAGLVTASTLSSPKVRYKLGSSATLGQNIEGEKVSVFDSLKVQNIFASEMSYPLETSNYSKTEPVWISSLSSSVDGETIVLTGIDAYSCKETNRQFQTIKLLRAKDAKTISVNFARKSGTQAWTDVISKPCDAYDTATGLELDLTIKNADFIGKDGDYYLIAIHSFIRFDEEIRLARFKVDFDSETVSDLTMTEISSNTL